MLSKSQTLCKVQTNQGMLLLPAKHSTPGTLEECLGVIGISMYCLMVGLILDVGVGITFQVLPGERMVDHT